MDKELETYKVQVDQTVWLKLLPLPLTACLVAIASRSRSRGRPYERGSQVAPERIEGAHRAHRAADRAI